MMTFSEFLEEEPEFKIYKTFQTASGKDFINC